MLLRIFQKLGKAIFGHVALAKLDIQYAQVHVENQIQKGIALDFLSQFNFAERTFIIFFQNTDGGRKRMQAFFLIV